MPTQYTRKEISLLRQLAQEAWEAELTRELEELFETFCKWADKGVSAFDLSDQIHEFHNGVSRELYNRYTGLPLQAALPMQLHWASSAKNQLIHHFWKSYSPSLKPCAA